MNSTMVNIGNCIYNSSENSRSTFSVELHFLIKLKSGSLKILFSSLVKASILTLIGNYLVILENKSEILQAGKHQMQ